MDPEPAKTEERDDRVLAPTRWVSIGIVPVLCAAFVILFFFPTSTKELWAWTVPHPTMTAQDTPLTGRVIAAFVAFPAVTWLLFATDRRWRSFEIAMETATIGLALVLIATIRASDEFDGKAPGYAALLVATLAGLIGLQVVMRRRVPG